MNFVLQSRLRLGRIQLACLGNIFLAFFKDQINGPSFPHLDLHKTLSHWTITLLRITQIPSLGKEGTLSVLCSNFPAPYGEFSQKLPHFFALLKVEKNWAKYLGNKTVDTMHEKHTGIAYISWSCVFLTHSYERETHRNYLQTTELSVWFCKWFLYISCKGFHLKK